MTFINLDIETDPEQLKQDVIELLQDRFPGWEPALPNLETWLIEGLAEMTSDLMDLAVAVPEEIMKEYGRTIVSIPPIEAAPATVTSTWTAVDNAGYTIPAGTQVLIEETGNVKHAFEVVEETDIDPGDTTASVLIEAVEYGEQANGLTADPELLDALAFIAGITTADETSGGTDEEDNDVYLDRLAEELTLLAPRPILPGDFEVLARRHTAVWRATALDGYEPVGPSSGNDRTISVAVVQEDGTTLSSGEKDEVDALLQAEREVNFDIYVIDPTFTAIDVDYEVTAHSGFSAADVETDVTAALEDYLSPANWGKSPFQDDADSGQDRSWLNITVVRYLEVAEVINRVAGVHYIDDLSVEGGTADVNLTGAAPLTQAGTITGAVNET